MRRFINRLYYETTIGHVLIHPLKRLYDIYRHRLLPEKIFIRRTFKASLDYDLNLENPKTINEKIQWLQLNDRNPLHTICTDKYAVRKYIKEKIGEQYLIPLVCHTTNSSDIIPENLPDYPFIIKTNHGNGGHLIVKDKSKIVWKSVQKKFKKSLKSNYYYNCREWQYKDIKPRIVVEKLLLDENSNIPYDYKFHCFNGEVKFIHVVRYISNNRRINFYDLDWNFVECEWGSRSNGVIKQPEMLNKMKSLAEVLAEDFQYVRVDLYIVGNKIYFGELTFSPLAGFQPLIPSEWDRIFGDELVL